MSIHADSTSPGRRAPTIQNRKVPIRRTNAAYRSREYLAEKEVETLMESAASVGRHGTRDASGEIDAPGRARRKFRRLGLTPPSPLPLALWRLPIRIYETLVEQALLQGPAADEERARLLNNLSHRLSESGDRAGALRAIEEAVEIYRRLAQAQPAAFEPDLADSLNNLSVQLGESGDRAGALRAIEEVVAIYRRLAQALPAAFEPALATSLNTLSNTLSDSGDRAGALRAIEEAVAIRRRLAQAEPAAFEPDLAGNLNTLSNRLSESGDAPGALRAIEQATEILRRLHL
jgi:tetratricopeptide (TPR) repeat protein